MQNKLAILAAAGLASFAAYHSQAQPYAIAGDFNGWNNTAPLDGGPTIYTNNMTGGTPGNFQGCKIIAVPGNWGTTYPASNLEIKYDASGNNTVYFYPGTFSDGWLPAQNRVGFEDPGNMSFEVTGDFTNPNWGDDPNGLMTLDTSSVGVYTNIFVFPTTGPHNFKIRTPGTWSDFNGGQDFGGDRNVVVTTIAANQAVTIQLDLLHGRLRTSVPPVYCNVQFSVDMTLVVANDPGFDPASVTVNGDALLPNGWGGTTCTNDPNAANPNVFTSLPFSIAVGTHVQYQFRYLSSGSTVYDALGGASGVNRTVLVPNMAGTNIPPVYFNDALPTDLLNVDTTVYFNVNMTNAVGTDAHVFNQNSDNVFMNGDFAGWLGWDPISLAAYKFTNNPPGSEVYTLGVTFPKGHSRSLTYKYAINGADNEAVFGQNHFRYIRSTSGEYNLPMDTFGNQYNEPKVGGLAIGGPSGGAFPITWLPYPNVRLQSSSNLTSWLDVGNTIGAGATNWPAGPGSQFFRLIQK